MYFERSKMATIAFIRFYRCPCRLIFHRLLRQETESSTLKHFCSRTTVPIKYTTNKVAKIPISETLGIMETKHLGVENKITNFSKYIILGSLCIFIVYFSIIREESDIDENLKIGSSSKAKELLNLKLHLIYCEKNNLPTKALKEKIMELEGEKKIVSPFIK